MVEIPGYLSPDDERFLQYISKPGSIILEIGTCVGRSASILAESGAEVHTVEIDEPSFNQASENLKNLSNVYCYLADSKDFKWNKDVDVLWIDGDHSNEGVRNDINRFSKFVKIGGIICGHDYTGSECTVYHVVDELIKESPDWDNFHIESTHIWVARKK